MTPQESRYITDLLEECSQRRFSRRQFVGRASAIGLGASAMATAVARFDSIASAQGTEPSGSIVISLAAEPITLEAWHAYSTLGVATHRNCYEALLNRDPSTNELIGELATAWEWVDDKTIDFTLREGVTFHNGATFDANDVVATYAAQWDASNPNHVGNSGAFEYVVGFFGALLNAPPQ